MIHLKILEPLTERVFIKYADKILNKLNNLRLEKDSENIDEEEDCFSYLPAENFEDLQELNDALKSSDDERKKFVSASY